MNEKKHITKKILSAEYFTSSHVKVRSHSFRISPVSSPYLEKEEEILDGCILVNNQQTMTHC